MSHHHFALASLTLLLFAGCAANNTPVANRPRPVQNRDHVTYYAADWAHGDAQHKIDLYPQPEGGMAAFVSHLAYPPEFRRQRITGTMIVRVSIDSQGRVLSAQVVRSVDPTLDAIVLRAVREQRWQPAQSAGRAVSYTFRFPITFRLRV